MARNTPRNPENIYRMCRLRAEEASGLGHFKSQEDASIHFTNVGYPISSASLKKYENGDTIPPEETVKKMAEIYGTPELKWLHCSQNCKLGQSMTLSDPDIGTDDIYHTYFELAGAFDKIEEIESSLHTVISDDKLGDCEVPALNEILSVLDRIAENAKDLRIWAEKRRNQISSN